MSNITGWFSYKGTTAMQHEDVASCFEKLIKETKPSQILEIGTALGGLSLLLLDLLMEHGTPTSTLRTYDVHVRNLHWLDKAIEEGARGEIFVENVFNHNYTELEKVEKIRGYIQQPGCTIVLCDGGNKIKEFNILSQHLKPGDIIMAHDYAPNINYFREFNKDKIWNWCEIQDSDIEECSKVYNLEPFMQDDFTQVVWVCKIKK